MKVGIMQPYFMPYLGYFQLINAVDQFVILDDVNFIKKGFINRNRILLNNQPHTFTLPLIKASQNKLICDTEIQIEGGQIAKIFKTIENAYVKAPFYDMVYPLLKEIFAEEDKNLSSYVANSIMKISRYLNISTEIIPTSREFEKGLLKGQDRILDIAKSIKAEKYYNPIGGKELYSYEDFKKQGISLSFIKMTDVKYDQGTSEFHPNLSIIDVLMFNSKEDIGKLLSNYVLE